MKEVWKDVPNYEGLYQVSNFGKVKSLKRKTKNSETTFRIVKEKVLKPKKNKTGYLFVSLSKNGKIKNFNVHKLVSQSFLNDVLDGTQKLVVDHIDGDKTNNSVKNLQITTQRYNVSKKKVNKTSIYTGVCWYKTTKKWMSAIKINGKRKHLGYFNNEYEAHLAYRKELNSLNNK